MEIRRGATRRASFRNATSRLWTLKTRLGNSMVATNALKALTRAQAIAVLKNALSSQHGVGAVLQTIIARYAITGVNIFTGILTARVLGAQGRGEQSAMLAWPALLAYLLTLGLPTAIRYCIRSEPERRSELFTAALLAAGAASIVAIAIGVFGIPFWLHNYPNDVIWSAQLLMIFSPEVMLGLILTAMLEAVGRFATANVARYITTLLTLAALIFLTLAHEMTPFRVSLAYTAAPVFVACWVGWQLRTYIAFTAFDPRPAIRILASYGLRSYGIDVLGVISESADQVFVISFLASADVGIYVVALSASRIITILHGAVVSVVFPSAAGLSKAAAVLMVERAARISTIIATVLAIMLAALLPFLIGALYGHAFSPAVNVARVLAIEAVIAGLAYVLAQAFMAVGRPGVVTLFQGVGLLVVFPAMAILVPRFGLTGAALALLSSTIVRLIFVLAAFPSLLQVALPTLIPTGDDLREILAIVRSPAKNPPSKQISQPSDP